MSQIDLGAARHCARIAASHYRHAGIELPSRLREHLRSLDNSFAEETKPVVGQAHSEHEFIDTAEAARILGCSPQYVRRIHTDLDGQRIAGRWLFDRDTVTHYAHAKGHHAQHRRPVVT